MGFPKTKILPVFFFFLFSLVITNSTAQLGFKCTQKPTSKCNSIIGYKSPNATTLSSLQNLFGVSDFNSLLGANNFPSSTKPNYAIKKDQVVRIPFPCVCSNGTGVSDGMPKYKVVEGNFLFYIANSIFMGFVNVDQIVEVNKIVDPNKINIGDELIIPLPCSCDEVEREIVVHYGHLVEGGSSMEEIAKEYGTNSDLLFSINGITNDSQLIAGKPIDIPIKACNSSINPTSLDYPLLVSNGTYTFTANGCVKCKCDSANNWMLECEPSGLKPATSTWPTCPSAQCSNGADNLLISNTTATTGCNTTTCSYAGFNNQTILTALTSLSTCPTPVPDSGNGDNNYASRSDFSWTLILLIFIPMLSVYF